MAVLVEGYSVIISMQRIRELTDNDIDLFMDLVPSTQYCTDGEVFRVGFMDGKDAMKFIAVLEEIGFVHLASGKSIDIALTDQIKGIHDHCSWLEFARVPIPNASGSVRMPEVAAVKRAGSFNIKLFAPNGWQ